MTTIVYDTFCNMVACDSRTTTKNMIVTDNAKKWFDVNGWRVFCSGETCDIHKLEESYKANSFESLADLEFIKYHHEHGVWYGIVEGGKLKTEPLASSYAIGSGQKAAMYGLRKNHDLKDLINTVKTIDFRTGGEVHCFDVTEPVQ
ncbi:hypothetical protein [Pseudoalteromonas sp. Of7M-16]|uniref:hypothetical protein n=1 Tax=Pseudoalteromonas sp. Of7M-16 TaxID=2917756 RepID=UPI001EF47B3C|nr:hypothetical protein [Pseudoalteromonas sp. Of7M-16]MCG7548564.1 hypothetical protein [Pseudoalteromonas sp. Of7M-16]